MAGNRDARRCPRPSGKAVTLNTEQGQRAHFDRIATQYELHYSDECSQRYREKFLNNPMLAGIELSGLKVLEAMCGSGQTTVHLLSRGAKVTGLDISSGQTDLFKKRWTECDAVCGSIFDTGFEDGYFDCVTVVLGLHHLHPELERAIDEIYRIVKPGGYFCFIEPHAGSFPDLIRKLWYKVDGLFQKNEGAVDIDYLESKNSHRFEFIKTKYVGNVAYIFVLCSLILRIPLSLKKFYTPLLLKLESIIGTFQGKKLSCLAICQWKKTE